MVPLPTDGTCCEGDTYGADEADLQAHTKGMMHGKCQLLGLNRGWFSRKSHQPGHRQEPVKAGAVIKVSDMESLDSASTPLMYLPIAHGVPNARRPTEEYVQPANKRRKVTPKQPPPDWYWEMFLRLFSESLPGWRIGRQAKDFFITHCRWKDAQQDDSDDSEDEQDRYERKRQSYADQWGEMPGHELAMWKVLAAEGRPGIGVPDEWGRSSKSKPLPIGLDHARVKATGVVFTWNGDFHKDLAGFMMICEQEDLSLDEKLIKMRQLPCLREFGKSSWQFLVRQAKLHHLPQLSFSIELSCNAEEFGRLHAHAVVSSGGSNFFLKTVWDNMTVGGIKASHVVPSCGVHSAGTRKGAISARRTNEAHYYLQFAKVGWLFQTTNHRKAHAFPVSAKWIWNQVQVNKMSLEVAKKEVLLAKCNVRNSLAELDVLASEVEKVRIQEMREAVAAKIQQKARPFAPLPQFVQCWLESYQAKNAEGQTRRMPLVMEGPTRTGKTVRAKGFWGAAETLVLNCQGQEQPPMMEFAKSPTKYKCIVFDEADWKLVFKNKALFQAGNDPITLGQSRCNTNAYDVYVYAVPMIVCSNNFWEQCNRGGEEEAWIKANIVHWHISEPVYECEPRAHAASH